MEKIIHKLINEFTEGVDTYTHNGSTWLIYTESKEWVIELTENKTLWYNYNFFKSVFAYTSLDCVQNQHLITKWVEDNIINKQLIYSTLYLLDRDRKQQFEDTLKNGVKETLKLDCREYTGDVDDIIQDGVKEIYEYKGFRGDVKDVIQDGVRSSTPRQYVGEDIIDKIIDKNKLETKMVPIFDFEIPTELIENVIDDGVKETHDDAYHHKGRIDGVIKNGVKETHREICEYKNTIDYIIQTGVKETKTPGKDGDILGVMDWMEENKTNSVPKMIDDVIENGVKETKPSGYSPTDKIGKVVTEGVKVSGTFVGGKRQKEDVESVIGYGTKNPTD
jgi:hypothetical protein